jgi:hypothetical protein
MDFKIGGLCICVDAFPGASVKNGIIYEVYSYEQVFCQGNWYWYIGVQRGRDFKTHNRVRPSIFRPLVEIPMEFKHLIEEVPILSN